MRSVEDWSVWICCIFCRPVLIRVLCSWCSLRLSGKLAVTFSVSPPLLRVSVEFSSLVEDFWGMLSLGKVCLFFMVFGKRERSGSEGLSLGEETGFCGVRETGSCGIRGL